MVLKLNFKYAVEMRLRYIEFCLENRGGVKRGDLVSYFGISTQQASFDINLYRRVAKGNIEYDMHLKCFKRLETYKRWGKVLSEESTSFFKWMLAETKRDTISVPAENYKMKAEGDTTLPCQFDGKGQCKALACFSDAKCESRGKDGLPLY